MPSTRSIADKSRRRLAVGNCGR